MYVTWQQFNHLASLAKWLSVCLQTKWLWAWIWFLSLRLEVMLLFESRFSLHSGSNRVEIHPETRTGHLYFIIYLFISQTQIYTITKKQKKTKKNTSYKFKQKICLQVACRKKKMFCCQAPLNIEITSMINFCSLLYDPPAENTHYRGHCYLNLKLIIIISSIQF